MTIKGEPFIFVIICFYLLIVGENVSAGLFAIATGIWGLVHKEAKDG